MTLRQSLARFVLPARLAWRDYQFDRALRRLAASPAAQPPSRQDLIDLYALWGNQGWSADPAYLQELASQAVTTPGPVLECGSGLSTLLLGLLAGRRGVQIWSLEHIQEWHSRVAGVLRHHAIPGVRLWLAPLRDYGAFSWYDAPFQEMPADFRLVICDGPPSTTPGGRYGLMPLLKNSMADEVTILFDDATNKIHGEALQRWQAEGGWTASIHPRTIPGAYAWVRRAGSEAGSTT